MNVPFYKPSLTNAEIDEVVGTLRSGWLTTGPRAKQFEQEFACYIAQKHAVAVNSCTAALHLALEAVGVKAGDTVVVPTMTFAASAEVVRYFNAHPLLVDCRSEDFNLDVADAERRILEALAHGGKVTAIIPVHYGGQVGDMAGVAALARKYGLKIVEDAAHCCPAYYRSENEEGRMKKEGRGKAENGKRKAEGITTPHQCPHPQPLSHPMGEGCAGLCPVEAERVVAFNHQPSTINSEIPRATRHPGAPHPAYGHLLPRAETGFSPNEAERASSLNHQLTANLPSTFNSRANLWLPVGSNADITCFSFYANKCITTGEGGMACTQNDGYAERMRIMSLHGISKDAWKRFTAEGSWYYEIVAPGFKYNLTDIASAIGIHQLRRADELHRKRQQAAALYAQLLEDVEEIILPRERPDRIHSWHLYAIRLRLDRLTLDRAQIIQELKARGIGTSVHWLPLHEHPYYRETYGYQPGDFPMAAGLYPELITLPLYPDLTEAEVAYVCDALKSIIAANLRAVAAVCDRRNQPVVGRGS